MKYRLIITLLVVPMLVLSQNKGTLYFTSDQPLGNVAVTQKQGIPFQVFFTVHPESKPKKGHVFEIRNGEAHPFPDSTFQARFISPLGIYLDRQNRLWVLDHANYALKTPKLFAFDVGTGELLLVYEFSREIVRKWVMMNDLTVSPDGSFVIISAPGIFKKRSSMIVFNVAGKNARRLLTDHPTVMRKKILPEVDGKKMRFLLGLFKVRPGIDGIDMDPRGRYVYYSALADTVVYRIPRDAVTDPGLTDQNLSEMIQTVGYRPLCDGIRVDRQELVYITDFQNHRILAMDPDGQKKVILQNDRIRWADGLSIGTDGYLYITDSALQHVILQRAKKYEKHAPFGIWKVKVAATGG